MADEAGAQAKALKEVQRELRQLRADRARDRKLIEKLEEKLDQVQSQDSQVRSTNQQLQATTQQLQNSNQQLQTKTDAELKQIQAQVAAGPTEPQIARLLGGYWGSHQFTLTGGAAVDYIYDHKLNQNTFTLDFEPIMLYRPTTGWRSRAHSRRHTIPALAPRSTRRSSPRRSSSMTIWKPVLGIFDQPFGDFYETQGPFWVNRFITAPLPYRAAALVPPTDIGMQLRGAYQWGQLGQDADYTVWVANGPSYDSALPQPVVGQALNGSTNITTNTNGKAYGGRFRIYPFPLDSNLGRLELGASTYNGKWQNGLWLNAWGVDFAYLLRQSADARRVDLGLSADAGRVGPRQPPRVVFPGRLLSQRTAHSRLGRIRPVPRQARAAGTLLRASTNVRSSPTRFRPIPASAPAARPRSSRRMRARSRSGWITG